MLNLNRSADEVFEIQNGIFYTINRVEFFLKDDIYTAIKFKKSGSDPNPVILTKEANGSFVIEQSTSFYAGEISFGFEHAYKNNNVNIETPVNFMEEKRVETNKKIQEIN